MRHSLWSFLCVAAIAAFPVGARASAPLARAHALAPAVAGEASADAATFTPPAASFAEAADLFRGGTLPTATDLEGWWAGVEYFSDSPYLPNAAALTTSLDGTLQGGLRMMIAIAAQRPSDWFYQLDAMKLGVLRDNFVRKAPGMSLARVEGTAVVSYYAAGVAQYRNLVRRTADGRIAAVATSALNPQILAASVFDKRVFPIATEEVLLGVLKYDGGFSAELVVPVADKRPLVSFRLAVPASSQIEILEAGVRSGALTTKLAPTPGETVYPLGTPAVVDAVLVSLNGPVGKPWQIPVYGRF